MKGLTLPAALGICTAAFAAAPPPVPQSALQACAQLVDDHERLACYDRLARSAGAGQTPEAPVTPAAVSSPGAAPGGASAAPPKESFGLYAAEHPAPPPAAPAILARIEALGRGAGGRPTVTLEGGQLWELDEPDPLLAVGDTVSIRRAVLGSFILETPTKRMHRARRLH
jgi:hypothetical protein